MLTIRDISLFIVEIAQGGEGERARGLGKKGKRRNFRAWGIGSNDYLIRVRMFVSIWTKRACVGSQGVAVLLAPLCLFP